MITLLVCFVLHFSAQYQFTFCVQIANCKLELRVLVSTYINRFSVFGGCGKLAVLYFADKYIVVIF